jgi:hypothetical protein
MVSSYRSRAETEVQVKSKRTTPLLRDHHATKRSVTTTTMTSSKLLSSVHTKVSDLTANQESDEDA